VAISGWRSIAGTGKVTKRRKKSASWTSSSSQAGGDLRPVPQQGNGALVEGRLQMRKFETKDGQKVTKHEVVAGDRPIPPKRLGQGGEPPCGNRSTRASSIRVGRAGVGREGKGSWNEDVFNAGGCAGSAMTRSPLIIRMSACSGTS